MDGRINSVTITSSTIEAVDRALNGEDNSQGALFFLARASSAVHNVQWFENTLVKLFEYGGHEYFTYREYADGTDDVSAPAAEEENASESI
jgi:N-acetylmuramoyl-L-alanine amidase